MLNIQNSNNKVLLYRSDGEVGVQFYFACTAMQPAIKMGVRGILVPENQAIIVDRKNCIWLVR